MSDFVLGLSCRRELNGQSQAMQMMADHLARSRPDNAGKAGEGDAP